MNVADFTLKYFKKKGYGVVCPVPCAEFYDYVHKYLNITNAGKTADIMFHLYESNLHVSDAKSGQYRMSNMLVRAIMVNRALEHNRFVRVKDGHRSAELEHYRNDE